MNIELDEKTIDYIFKLLENHIEELNRRATEMFWHGYDSSFDNGQVWKFELVTKWLKEQIKH
jgi:hypothetical protein